MLQGILLVVFSYYVYHFYCLWRNIRIARSSGLPYIVTPFNNYSIFWMFAGPYIYPFLKPLPHWMRMRWIAPEWNWNRGYEAYKEMKSDMFIVVHADGCLLWVADADVVHDIVGRRDDFPKPIHVYGVLDIFGKNVVTTTGPLWRIHRKITSPQFNERNNRLVWTESIQKSHNMLSSWTTPLPQQTQEPLIKSLAEDCMRLALHIISWAGFGIKLKWPKRVSETSYDESLSPDETLGLGHTMSFQSSLHYLLEYCYVILASPNWYLKYTPVKMHRVADKAYYEWDLYMREMIEEKQKEIEIGTARGDIMGALVRANDGGRGSKGEPVLCEQDVIGNTFIIILAGHETTANTTQYALMMLAIHPEIQIALQEEIDRILGDQEPDYEAHYQPLAEGWAGAIMNETLRLFPPVTNIPKWAPTPQPITYKDKTHILPAKMLIHLNASCVHRNPLYWILPGQTEEEAAINSFKPKRWFAAVKQTDDFDLGDNDEGLAPQGKDTSRAFFRPHKGSFIPFSEGSRACLGRKFANVEFVATLMVLFRYHSIELDVREGETYEDAKRRGWDYVKNSRIILTLKPNGREPGIRCVPRGRERWFPKRD